MPKEYINYPQPDRSYQMDVTDKVRALALLPIENITQRQEWLQANGLDLGPTGADGIAGIYYHGAVTEYQKTLKKQYHYKGDLDGRWGPDTQNAHILYVDDIKHGLLLPPAPRVGIHWDKTHGSVQLSLDIDWDVLQEMVKTRQDNPGDWYGEDEGNFPNRTTFYTAALDRAELQRLIKYTRSARNDAFGGDE